MATPFYRYLGVISLLAGVLATPGHASACDEPQALVAATERAIVSGRLAEVPDLVEATEAAFGCSKAVPRELLGRWYRVEAAWFSLSDASEEASLAWRSAELAAPGGWTEALGPAMRAEQETAIAATVDDGDGTIALIPPPTAHQGLLDGLHVPFPVSAPPGLHLIQITDPSSGRAVFARQVFLLDAGERFEVDTGPLPAAGSRPSPPPPPGASLADAVAPAPADAEATPDRWPLWAGLGAGALAGTAAVLARSQSTAMRNASDLDGLDAAWGRQRAFAYTAYGLGGIALVGVGFGITR